MRISDWSSDVCSSDRSDAFEGRAPGTAGEDRTIAYIVGEWAKAGLEPVPGSATPWLQPVPFVESEPLTSRATFKRHGRDIRLEDDSVIGAGRAAAVSLEDVDRKSVVSGKGVAVRVDLGGRRISKKKNKQKKIG